MNLDIQHVIFFFQHWKYKCAGPIFSSPVICSLTTQQSYIQTTKEVLIFGSHDRHVYCLTTGGHLLWKVKTESTVYASPFVFKSDDYFPCVKKSQPAYLDNPELSDPYQLLIPDTETLGHPKSDIDACTEHQTSLNLHQKNSDTLCCSQHSVFCVFACTSGTLYIVEVDTGRVVKEVKTPGEIFSSPVIEFPYMVIGCRDNYLYCYEITTYMP